MAGAVCILGASGRMGRELVRLADEARLSVVASANDASVVIVAIPSDAVTESVLASLGEGRSVIDMSGTSKRLGLARYGLLLDHGRLLDRAAPERGACFGNPGCIAASVLVGLSRAGLLDKLAGPLHVTAVGSASYAPPDQQGEIRLARRLHAHPHVAEIEAAHPAIRIASFAPVIAYGTPRGLLTVISGELATSVATPTESVALDVKDVVGTAHVRYRLEVNGNSFTLAMTLDNLTFPAANAIELARSLV
jgi:N-acetyl-gamma-glutamylphosphate reductase